MVQSPDTSESSTMETSEISFILGLLMPRLIPFSLILMAVTASCLHAKETITRKADSDFLVKFIQSHCVSCHGQDEPEADLRLISVDGGTLEGDAHLTRQLLHVLENREMPPEGEQQPGDEELHQVLNSLRPLLHKAVQSAAAHVRAPIRRMNRFQYNNAVTDLFQLNCVVFTLPERTMRIHKDYFQPETGKMPETVTVGNRPLGKSQMIEPRLAGVAAFPQDLRAEHGYDNQGDHLSMSPLLMDEFLKLGQSITESPDFNAERVGIWASFFSPPPAEADREAIVRSRLEPFLTRAFREQVSPDVLDRYSNFAIHAIENGDSYTSAMKAVAAAAISSPRFLYIYDRNTSRVEGGLPQSLSDFELASRLSFFLWGSLPDHELLTLAAQEKLSQPEILTLQIDRMLRDRKLKRFCDSFPSQWLQLDRILSSVPNRGKFPDFYYSKYRVSMHMMLEPLLLFETVLIENLPITQLIAPDFTYRSPKLEFAYGDLGSWPEGKPMPGGAVTLLNFKRVPVTDPRVGGVITNTAVMTMTSGPERTQPITRGAWMATVIFNDPPEPPPADVPPLPEKPHQGEENLSLRQRLAAHRERADCRGCHEQIDPLGFALENYNPTGRWRDHDENGVPINMSGQLFRQQSFSNVAEFKEAILHDKDRFCRALAGHLLSFALARKLGPADELSLDAITQAAARDGYRMQTLIRAIILSDSFRMKS
jgi:hypothetical protein